MLTGDGFKSNLLRLMAALKLAVVTTFDWLNDFAELRYTYSRRQQVLRLRLICLTIFTSLNLLTMRDKKNTMIVTFMMKSRRLH